MYMCLHYVLHQAHPMYMCKVNSLPQTSLQVSYLPPTPHPYNHSYQVHQRNLQSHHPIFPSHTSLITVSRIKPAPQGTSIIQSMDASQPNALQLPISKRLPLKVISNPLKAEEPISAQAMAPIVHKSQHHKQCPWINLENLWYAEYWYKLIIQH